MAFSDGTGSKTRPVVVIGWTGQGRNVDRMILTVPVHSFSGGAKPTESDILMQNAEASELSSNSYIRTSRVYSYQSELFIRSDNNPIITLNSEIMYEVIESVAKLFDVAGVAQFP